MRPAQRGVALLVVLWGCTLAAITLGALAASSRVESMQARAQSLRTEAFYAAQAGIEQAVFALRVHEPTAQWMADGRPYPIQVGRVAVVVSVWDDDGKINLNTASPELIEALLHAAGVEDDRVGAARAAIVGWGTHGRVQASALLAKGGFSSLEELRRVPGLAPDIAARIEPALSLWSPEEPNLAHASPLVVAAVTGAGAEASAHFVAEVQAMLPGNTALPALPGNGSGMRSVGASGVVSIVSRARVDGGVMLTLNATLILKSEPGDPRTYRVVRWREVASSDAERHG